MTQQNSEGKRKNSASNKSFGLSPVLIGIVVIIVAIVIVVIMMRDTKTKSATDHETSQALSKSAALKNTVDSTDIKKFLKNLDKTVVIGSSLAKHKAKGSQFINENEITGLTSALENRNVNLVIDILEKANVKHVIVDPAIVVRNPIPKNTVRNRLALAHPAGKLNAKIMSKNFFIYELGKPAPFLTQGDKKTLLQIVRKQAGAQNAVTPDALSPLLKQKLKQNSGKNNKWQMILNVRRVQGRHLAFFLGNFENMAEGAEKLADRFVKYYNRKNLDKKFGDISEALDSKFNLELEIVYDEGTFVGPRDNIFLWRIIEPGIYGVKIVIDKKERTLPPWYSVTNNLRTVTSILERIVHKMGKQTKDYWKKSNVDIVRYRTIHWRERTPGGDIEDLYRASPHVPSPKEITRESMIKSLKGLTDWLAYNQTYDDDRSIYRYFPTKDTENGEYNQVRHSLGPFSMAMGQEFNPDPQYRKAAESSMRWMESRIRWGGAPRKSNGEIDDSITTWHGKPLPGKDVAILEADENQYDNKKGGDWANKMGAVSVAILGYTQFKKVGWELGEEHEKTLKGLANFLLYMQDNDGSFHHYYVAGQNHYYGTKNSIYPGEILYALARMYGETNDDRFKVAFDRSMKTNLDWFKREMEQKESDGTYSEERRKELVQFQPWIAMSMEEMHRYEPDPKYLEASNLVSLWVLDTYQFDETRAFYPDYLGGYMKVLDELPAMHTFVYTEGTAASYVLARRAGADMKTISRLRRGCLLAARFILQQQVRVGENDYYYPNPKKAKGAVRYCMNHNKQRIDYTYHALSSVFRIIHAATPEDYADIQSVPMPGTW